MYRTPWALSLVVLLAALTGGARGDEKPHLPDVLALQQVMQDAIRRAEPAIACVLVARGDEGKTAPLHDPDHPPDSYGSAVVVDEKGLLLTNYHVVREATRIHVRLPGDKASYAEIHAADPRSDLAVLRLLDAKVLPLRAMKFGDGAALRKGQFVLSIANPYAAGFRDGSPSASFGIISNLRRKTGTQVSDAERGLRLWHYGTLIQTDVKLNLGCSGGALVDLKGELVGMTTALAAVAGGESPGGFAVPMDAGTRRIIDVLRRGEEVEYGFLGVSFPRGLDGGMGGGEGLRLQSVITDSPAWRGGLRGGETILAMDDVPITSADDLFLQVGTLLAGTTCKIKATAGVGGQPQTHTVTLAKAAVDGKVIATRRPPAIGGLRVDYTSILISRREVPRFFNRGIPPGVMIREVVEGSPADTARLQPDKVILRVNGRAVNSPAEYYREMQNAGGAVELTLMTSDGREDRVRLETR